MENEDKKYKTIADLKAAIKDLPDDMILTFAGDNVGYTKATCIDLDIEKEYNKVNIYIGDEYGN